MLLFVLVLCAVGVASLIRWELQHVLELVPLLASVWGLCLSEQFRLCTHRRSDFALGSPATYLFTFVVCWPWPGIHQSHSISPFLSWTGEIKYNKRLLGQDGVRERSFTNYHNSQNGLDVGKSNQSKIMRSKILKTSSHLSLLPRLTFLPNSLLSLHQWQVDSLRV